MITSSSNSKVKYVRRLQADRRFRQREGAFVIEGTRWLGELRPFPDRVQFILYTAAWAASAAGAADLLAALDRPAFAVSEPVMAAASDTQTPAGVLAVVELVPRPLLPQPTLLLILDRVADPGNLGTIIRTASAAGIDGLLLAPGCVDPTNPKVVRSSMGALLRLPIWSLGWAEIGERLSGLAIWLAAADGEREYTAVNWQWPSALIVGSEASGAGPEARRLATGRIAITMPGPTESLNAALAAGIILFEAVRQRRRG